MTAVAGVFAAVALGAVFPTHDLTFLQLLLALGGFVVGLVLNFGFSRRHDKDR